MANSGDFRGFTLPHIPAIQLKLDRSNYAFWRALVLSAVRAHALDDFLSSTATSPSPLLPPGPTGDMAPNPEFVNWIRRDQYLVSWMLSAVGESMLGHVVRCRSSREIWCSLEQYYHAQSKAQTMQYRVQLQTTKKGNLSVEDYFMKMRGISDQLAAIGKPLDDDELLMHIMAGFGQEYEALVVNTIHRSDSPTLQDVQLAFQAYEIRISQQQSALLSHAANVAYRGRGSGGYGNSGGYGRGSGPGYGKGVRPNFGRVSLCQLCGRTGHVALKCFKRFDIHFTGQETSSPQPPAAASAFISNVVPPVAGQSDNEGHYMDSDGNWCVDSGATTHITHEFGNLAVSTLLWQ